MRVGGLWEHAGRLSAAWGTEKRDQASLPAGAMQMAIGLFSGCFLRRNRLTLCPVKAFSRKFPKWDTKSPVALAPVRAIVCAAKSAFDAWEWAGRRSWPTGELFTRALLTIRLGDYALSAT
jgi:hypothetical protein